MASKQIEDSGTGEKLRELLELDKLKNVKVNFEIKNKYKEFFDELNNSKNEDDIFVESVLEFLNENKKQFFKNRKIELLFIKNIEFATLSIARKEYLINSIDPKIQLEIIKTKDYRGEDRTAYLIKII